MLRDTIPAMAVDHIRRILGRVGRKESTLTVTVDHQSISATYTVIAEPSDTRPARAVVLRTEALNYATSSVRHLPTAVLTCYVLLGKPDLALQLAELGSPDQRVGSLRAVLDTCLIGTQESEGVWRVPVQCPWTEEQDAKAQVMIHAEEYNVDLDVSIWKSGYYMSVAPQAKCAERWEDLIHALQYT